MDKMEKQWRSRSAHTSTSLLPSVTL